MVDAEDWTKLTATYPKHPLSEVVPNHESLTKLKEHRLNMEKLDVKGKKDAQDAKIAAIKKLSFKDYYQPHDYVLNPRYTATWQRREEEVRNHRIEKGLLPEGECHNKEKLPDPTTNWVDNPKFVSKSLLVERRADELLNDQKKFEPFFETHING